MVVRVPRVPAPPLNFDSGCQAPVMRETLGTNNPNFFKTFKILLIAVATPSLFGEKIGWNIRLFWAGHPSSESPVAAPVYSSYKKMSLFLQITYHSICFLYWISIWRSLVLDTSGWLGPKAMLKISSDFLAWEAAANS